MEIPYSFKEILSKDKRIDGIVTYTISQYSQILEENNLYFFEEYTDHGIKHINSVLKSSEFIMDRETLKSLLNNSSTSIGVYILSVILHDIGMHITPEGLFSLICGKNDHVRIIELDEKTWKELWDDFLDEARRYGDREKINIIGNVSWEFRIPDIEHKDKLNGEDKKLIGEFIRKYHPRIAHEISINGFPTLTNNIPFASDLEIEIRNICGLLARSHGTEIRSLFDYLENNFQDTWIKPYNIELLFLMVVIRISDYFQIDSSRTPAILVKLKSFNSPISEYEHFKHLDVKYVQPYMKDPETLVFHCEPRNSKVFIKLQELFFDIQKELDKSWAILGEIYGKEFGKNQPKIVYRRVKSNIDNKIEFAKKINYIPEKISFNVSNELPKLLIGPLYGNDPTYGIRELIQNAVDSCREREFLEGIDYKGVINVSFYKEGVQLYFKIDDNGLGMSLNVVKNYFLEVGSSLRKSSSWKKEFVDENGNSKIQRSGKFGIGVLAAFLIGDKIILKTKNSSSKFGISLETNLNSEQIEVLKIQKESVGTTIIVPISDEIFKQLEKGIQKFDKWYTHSSPQVIYFDETGVMKNLGYQKYAPGYNDLLPNDWNDLKNEKFNKIIWTYNKDFYKNKDNVKLTCNGIVIPKVLSNKAYDYENGYYRTHIELPYISIFDFNGNLPLNLSRNNIDGELVFKDQLIVEIYKDLIGKLLLHPINQSVLTNNFSKNELLNFNHPSTDNIDILFSKKGFILRSNYFKEKNKNASLIQISPKEIDNILFDIKDSFIDIREKEDISMSSYQYQMNLNSLQSGGKLFFESSMHKKLFDNAYNRYPVGVRRNAKLINESEGFVEINYNYEAGNFELKELVSSLKMCNYILETNTSEIMPTREINTSEKILTEQLDILLEGNPFIPYDINERKIMFAKAFDVLKNYQEKYLNNSNKA